MTDLETRLRDAYQAVTQGVEPVDRLDELPSAVLRPTRRRRLAPAVALGAAVLILIAIGAVAWLVGQQSDDPDVLVPPSTVVPTSTTSTTALPTSTTVAPPTSITTAPPASVTTLAPRVLLTGTGLEGFEVNVATADQVVSFLTGLLGLPERDEFVGETVAQCPSGSNRIVTWSGHGYTVFFDDVFQGYLWQSSTVEAETPAGLGVGTSVGLLRAGHPDISIEETSLGWEFFGTDGLRGFVTGPENGDTVVSIGAADLCVFR